MLLIVLDGKSVKLLILHFLWTHFPLHHGSAPVQVREAVGGDVRLDTSRPIHWHITDSLLGRRGSELWKGLGNLFGCSCLFLVKEGIICDFIFFPLWKRRSQCDLWRVELRTQARPVIFTSSTHQFIDFPFAFMRVLVRQKPRIWLFFPTLTQ